MSETTGRAVFLSYAHEDAVAAQRIAEALRAGGIEVWFDQRELRGGDVWDKKIREQVETCALFLPVISSHTQTRREGYFRLEWNLADDRTHLMAGGTPFLVPVVVDDTKERGALVPKSFLSAHWTRLPGGEVPDEFCTRVKSLVDGPAAEASRRLTAARADVAVPPTKSHLLAWMWVALAVAMVGSGAVWLLGRKPKGLDDKSIAVLPFENRSADKEANASFTDGIHEDILTNLANIRELRVVSRQSVEQFRGSKKAMPQIARELGVAFILEGSVQRDGNKVRVTGQLIRSATDEHVWADKYDRILSAAGVFEIQTEVANAIATELKAALSPGEKKLIARRPTENLRAYELLLKAREVRRNRVGGDRSWPAKMEALLEMAVEADPKFAAAWAELANTEISFMISSVDTTPARLAKATAAIKRATDLAPDAPEVLRSLGSYYRFGMADRESAARQFEKLLRLQPNDSDANLQMGNLQYTAGRYSEGVAYLRKAVQLDPANLESANSLQGFLSRGRRFAEAMDVLRRMIALRPDISRYPWDLAERAFQASGSTHEMEAVIAQTDSKSQGGRRIKLALCLGDYAEVVRLDRLRPIPTNEDLQGGLDISMAYMIQGDAAAARTRLGKTPESLRAQLAADPENTRLMRYLARFEAVLGNKEAALGLADRVVGQLRDGGIMSQNARYVLAQVCAIVGEKDRAIAELTHLLHTPSQANIHELKVLPVFYKLRGDPRFEALVNDPKNNQPLF